MLLRLLAEVVSYPKSYFEILAQKGKKLFFIKNERADVKLFLKKLKKIGQ